MYSLIIIILIFTCIYAVSSLFVRDLISAILILSCYSFSLSLLWAILGAVDVAFTEAVAGAGALTIFMIVILFHTYHTARKHSFDRYKVFAFIIGIPIAMFLIWGSKYLPSFGSMHTPASDYLSPYYITQSYNDTHTPNIVTAILADYRSFDTLIETVVIFTAGIACLLILKVTGLHSTLITALFTKTNKISCTLVHPHKSIIVNTVTSILIPLTMLYSLYILFHGHYSPGGGFQAGILFGSSIILAFLEGTHPLRNKITLFKMVVLGALGVLLYATFGLVSVLQNGNFLNYRFLLIPGMNDAQKHSLGILGIEVGVFIAVSCTLVVIFLALIRSQNERKPL